MAHNHGFLAGIYGRQPEAGAVSGLGDIICVEGDCKAGEVLVAQMRATYATLTGMNMKIVANGPAIASMIRQKYWTPMTAIVQSYNAQQTWARRWMPFSAACCTIRDIGRQAQQLTEAMAKDANVSAPGHVNLPAPNASGPLQPVADAFNGLAKLVMWGGAIMAVYVVYNVVTGQHEAARRYTGGRPYSQRRRAHA